MKEYFSKFKSRFKRQSDIVRDSLALHEIWGTSVAKLKFRYFAKKEMGKGFVEKSNEERKSKKEKQ